MTGTRDHVGVNPTFKPSRVIFTSHPWSEIPGGYKYIRIQKKLKTSDNQRLRSAGEDDAFLAIWAMNDLGAHSEKGFVLGGEIFVHEDTFLPLFWH